MKRILVLNYEFPPLGGGAGNATYYLLKEFAKNNKIFIDLVTSSIGEYKEEQFSDNIKIYYLNIGKKGLLHYQKQKDLLIYSWKTYWFCKKLKNKEKYDLIHAFFGIPCGFIALLLKLPYIVSLRGSDVPFYNKRFFWLDKYIFQYLSKLIWRKAESVVTNSQGLKNLANQILPTKNINIIYNGVDMVQFRPISKKNNELVFLSTSRLIKRKGVEYLIYAFLDFIKLYKNCKLLILGDGDLKSYLMQLVNKSEFKKNIFFLGTIDHKNLHEYYQQSDVFILPSLNEGMSNSILEAMASGLAVITTDTGGTKELINENNGIIIDKHNARSIYLAMENLYLNKKLLNKIKISNREKVINFSWKNIANQYLTLYLNQYD